MSTREVMDIVAERRLILEVKDGRLILRKDHPDNPNVTDKLLAVLKIHQHKIVEILGKS